MTLTAKVMNTISSIGKAMEPKCDFCKTPESERMRYSDGVGIMACQQCWDKVEKIENPHVVTPKVVADLVEALEWFISEDETNRGGEWEHKNAYWIDGLERGREAVANAKGEPYEREVIE